MTNEQRERLARYRNNGERWQYKWPFQYIRDLEAEREAVVNFLKSKCDTRTNPGGHQTAYEALVIYGERPEAEERT